jgi:hypothetical protein
MSGFFYKGVDIYEITNGSNTSGNPIPGHDLKGTRTDYTGLRPNDFGFSYQGVSISNSCTAQTSSILTTGSSITCPTGCKHVSIIAVGGAGGNGGTGGTVTYRQRAGISKYAGGGGGSGANGTIIYVDKVTIVNSSISYSIGGNGYTNSGTKLNRSDLTGNPHGESYSGTDKANGGNGGNGNDGGATNINIGDGITYTAPGGHGGGGGNGASSNNREGGKAGVPGSTPKSNYPTGHTYPTNGGSSLQFIWFYE